MATGQPRPKSSPWFIACRWQQFEGEARANVLRLAALATFYIIHLFHYYGARLSGWFSLLEIGEGETVSVSFHYSITLLTVAWTMLAIGILVCLRERRFPWWLPFFSTCCDIAFLTSVLYLADGPRSPLVVGYFLLMALAALRFSLPLVRMATLGSVLGYVALLGCARWPQRFGLGTADLRVPRYHQLIVLAALVFCGIMLGQIIRRVRALAEEYSDRVERQERSSA